MKKSIMLICVMSWLCLANTNPERETRTIENSDRIILVDPNAVKEINEKENAVLLLESSNEQNNESEASDSQEPGAKKGPNKEVANPLDYNLQPVENASGAVESNSQKGEKKHIDLMISYHLSIS